MKKLVFLIAVFLVVFCMNSCDLFNQEETQIVDIDLGGTSGDGWTFMIYIAADNDLSEYAGLDINEMEQGLYDSNKGGNSSLDKDIRILVLKDQTGSNNTCLYLIQPDDDPSEIKSKIIVDGIYEENMELDMSDPKTLSDFVSFSINNCPSKHNALILWNHGGGVKSSMPNTKATKEFCEDDGEYMYTNELQQALYNVLTEDSATPPLTILGFDACLMGTIESAYEYREVASYYTASIVSEWGYGWGYSEIFKNFKNAGNPPTAEEMADILVKQYYESTKNYGGDHTMASINTAKLETLKEKIDSLAVAIYNEGDSSYQTEFETLRNKTIYPPVENNGTNLILLPYYDLYDLYVNIEGSTVFGDTVINAATDVKDALAQAVVASYGQCTDLGYNYYTTEDADALRGFSILIPNGEKTYNTDSYYDYAFWYTSKETTTSSNNPVGGLDFCTYDDDGIVESWRELFEAWYVNSGAEY